MIKRKYRTDEEKKAILLYADEQGTTKTEKKFRIGRSQIYSWRTLFEAPKKPKKSSQKARSAKDGKRAVGMKAIRYSSVLDGLANEALNEDRTEEALALFAGAFALRNKATS